MPTPRTDPMTPAARIPRARLVPRRRTTAQRSWPVALPASGLWKVTGEAGSGVSSFLVDTAVAAALRLAEQGGDASGIVVVTDSKEAAARLRAEMSDRLARLALIHI